MAAILKSKMAAFLMLFSISEIESLPHKTWFKTLRLCFCYILRQKYGEKENTQAAILKFKMAARYHGNRDGYLALKNSPSVKLHLCQFSRFCQKSERFSPLASPLYVVGTRNKRFFEISAKFAERHGETPLSRVTSALP